jgi:hypothetical protein
MRTFVLLLLPMGDVSALCHPAAQKAHRNAKRHSEPLMTSASEFERLQGIEVLRVEDGSSCALRDEWRADERAAVFLLRSFG